jgi:tetratricopeptide (TPR) repeat protein
MMRIALYSLLVFLVFWQSPSMAEEWRKDPGMLPQYCQDRVKGIGSAEFARWRNTFGEIFVHIHHYCNGIYAEQKAKGSFNRQEKERWLRSVAGEMSYVGRHCKAGCVLYPELETRWGWALAQLGQTGEAIDHFQQSIKAKPKYIPAYAKLSDAYLDIGKVDEARKVLNQGLKAKPGSRMLKRRLKELDTTSG